MIESTVLISSERLALLAALLAGLCWALGSIVAMNTTRRIGAISFNRWRMFYVFFILIILSYFFSYKRAPNLDETLLLLLSGIVGIFVGDSALFLSLSRVGPRRTSMVFASHAPLTVLFGSIILSEFLTWLQLGGVVLTFSGIIVAIFYGKRSNKLDVWEDVRGSLRVGLCIGLLAASSHAIGALVARPVMAAGVDPLLASTIRVFGAVVFYFLLLFCRNGLVRAHEPAGYRGTFIIIGSGVFGMVLGASFYLYGLSGADAGIVATLASLSPVLMLPLLWLRNGYPPSLLAWVGALMASLGATMIFHH